MKKDKVILYINSSKFVQEMDRMGREAISDSLLLGRTGLREDISPNQSLDDPTSTSTSLTPSARVCQ